MSTDHHTVDVGADANDDVDKHDCGYKRLDREAIKLGAKYENFYRAVDMWDNSGYMPGYDDNNNDGWGALCKEKYYSGLSDVINRFRSEKNCPHFMKGKCKHGNECRYLHPRNAKIVVKTDKPCQHFLRGTCKFGDSCKYEHPKEHDKDKDNQNIVDASDNTNWPKLK
jgi:hypothetical protein